MVQGYLYVCHRPIFVTGLYIYHRPVTGCMHSEDQPFPAQIAPKCPNVENVIC